MVHAQRSRASSVAAGAVAVVAFGWFSCAPGRFPCDEPEWAATCYPDGGPGTMPPPPPGKVTRETEVSNCAQYKTLGAMDNFFANRCGIAAACHASEVPWTNLKAPDVWQRLLNVKPKAVCNKTDASKTVIGSLIDGNNWENSILLAKSKHPPTCPPGTDANPMSAGDPMPPTKQKQASLGVPEANLQDDLSDAERVCIAGFVRAAAGQNP
jgi:hypothetical protein